VRVGEWAEGAVRGRVERTGREERRRGRTAIELGVMGILAGQLRV
jgi:hypothetical protein